MLCFIFQKVKLQRRSSLTRKVSNNNELLLVPPPVSFRPTLGGRIFSYAKPVEWNSLPSSVRHITSLATFKEHLKTYFYRKAFL